MHPMRFHAVVCNRQYVESSAKRCAHEVLVPTVDFDVAERNGWHARAELDPIRSPVGGEVDPELRSQEQEVRIYMVLLDCPYNHACR